MSAGPRQLGPRAAVALVFGSSAAVLVVELVALRLLAPYLGLTLETNTLVIGIALAAIALGSWAGGRLADVVDPRRTIAPALAVSGVATALTPFVVRGVGASGDPLLLMTAAAVSIIVPGALLSAVTPMVTKLRLTDLASTGTVVGRLSGIGTAGSIVGTVLTGFVLVSRVPVSWILVGLGVALAVAALAVQVGLRVGRRGAVASGVPLLLVAGGGLAATVAPGGCDAETTYHCASVETDPERESGRILVLDGLRHSYVDLEDPTHLEFAYVQAMAAVVDTAYPSGEALRAYHLGGGGLTLPRYLDHVRPGTDSLVSEIDGGVLALDREELGLETGDGIEVRVEDGRLALADLPDASRDLVVGDAFGGVSVPWHLATREAIAEVRRVLTADGTYVANVIDHGDLAFVRAEVATVAAELRHVAVLGEPVDLATGPDAAPDGGNFVVVASDAPLDLAPVRAALGEGDSGWTTLAGADLEAWVDGADVLTDDHAPVDQLLEPYAAPGSGSRR
ncbi:fused MFS/spermidine synthase [Nocardioides zeae]|uniref:Fused MFS/spermidine synthase n=1 Tax=Nocardioides imazamoxiresistens TaxID=3231893 RepID=A0ABU3PUN0_9ACTN|nr:fused MFS/spermidine synthase [Nocardioides zeae]MDT9592938.1 fused MFS/spermidine synthase [Nocardioides zeae]